MTTAASSRAQPTIAAGCDANAAEMAISVIPADHDACVGACSLGSRQSVPVSEG